MPKIVFDRDKIDEMPLDDLFGFFEGNIYLMYRTLARFVVDDDGAPMSFDDGQNWLRKNHSVGQLTEAGAAFLKAIKDGSVPPESGGV